MLCALHEVGFCRLCVLHGVCLSVCRVRWVGFISWINLCPPIGRQVCMLCALHVVGLGAWGVGWVEFFSYPPIQECMLISCIMFSYPPTRGYVCMVCALHGVGFCGLG